MRMNNTFSNGQLIANVNKQDGSTTKNKKKTKKRNGISSLPLCSRPPRVRAHALCLVLVVT